MRSIAFDRQRQGLGHLDHDLFIDHKIPDDGVAVQHVEEVFASGRDLNAVFDFSVGDLQSKGEVGVLSVIDGL